MKSILYLYPKQIKQFVIKQKYGKFWKIHKSSTREKRLEPDRVWRINKMQHTSCQPYRKRQKPVAFSKLKLLSELFELEYENLKDLYFADKFAKDAYQHKCSENVFSVAKAQTKYFREINTTQGKLKF